MIHTSKVIHVSVLQPPSSSDVVINATSDYLTNEGIIYDTESVLYDEKKLNVRLTFPYYYASTRAYQKDVKIKADDQIAVGNSSRIDKHDLIEILLQFIIIRITSIQYSLMADALHFCFNFIYGSLLDVGLLLIQLLFMACNYQFVDLGGLIMISIHKFAHQSLMYARTSEKLTFQLMCEVRHARFLVECWLQQIIDDVVDSFHCSCSKVLCRSLILVSFCSHFHLRSTLNMFRFLLNLTSVQSRSLRCLNVRARTFSRFTYSTFLFSHIIYVLLVLLITEVTHITRMSPLHVYTKVAILGSVITALDRALLNSHLRLKMISSTITFSFHLNQSIN